MCKVQIGIGLSFVYVDRGEWSHYYTQEIADVKSFRILDFLPGSSRDRIFINFLWKRPIIMLMLLKKKIRTEDVLQDAAGSICVRGKK